MEIGIWIYKHNSHFVSIIKISNNLLIHLIISKSSLKKLKKKTRKIPKYVKFSHVEVIPRNYQRPVVVKEEPPKVEATKTPKKTKKVKKIKKKKPPTESSGLESFLWISCVFFSTSLFHPVSKMLVLFIHCGYQIWIVVNIWIIVLSI